MGERNAPFTRNVYHERNTRLAPEFGSVFISMNGPDQTSARTHTTIAVPGATPAGSGAVARGRRAGAGSGSDPSQATMPTASSRSRVAHVRVSRGIQT